MKYWNYRIIKLEDKLYNEVWYEMREVYYNEDDSIEVWSSVASTFSIKSIKEAKELNSYVLQALVKPILALVIDDNGVEHLEEMDKTLYDLEEIEDV